MLRLGVRVYTMKINKCNVLTRIALCAFVCYRDREGERERERGLMMLMPLLYFQ